MALFQLHSPFAPRGDQPQALEKLARGLAEGRRDQVLLGVTGSGKTFTLAQVIARAERPVLVLSHNKTLAAQLYAEFRDFFPHHAVEYFVSYYDYYQPEAYLPATDVYIEKDASINEDLDRLRLSATAALLSRRDVIIVASVSAIYGLGSPEAAASLVLMLEVGARCERRALLRRLTEIHYVRHDSELCRGKFRVRGDAIDIFPAYDRTAFRVEFFDEEIETIREIDPLTGELLREQEKLAIYPAKHYLLPEHSLEEALASIGRELEERLQELHAQGKLLEAQRLESRTRYDLEMLAEVGYCNGIENYSRHLDGRPPGSRPYTLLDFFPDDFLLIIDESHVTVPQLKGMYLGDRSRKETLVEHGFRLPSALDNRPMTWEEFAEKIHQVIFVSATPAPFEIARAGGAVVEQIIRPTGLVDPEVEVRPTENQIPDLVEEIRRRAAAGERVLVTTLTKRMAEHLAAFLRDSGLRGKYLHSEIDAIERVQLLRELRAGEFDVLVGVNLLREGLDLPEVSLVAILDADKEGFLRSQTSLIQTIGRAARHLHGRVILYADEITPAMRETLGETNRRREAQLRYNAAHGITPETIRKEIKSGIEEILQLRRETEQVERLGLEQERLATIEEINALEARMLQLAEELRFEEAAELRDRLWALRAGHPVAESVRSRGGVPARRRAGGRRAKRTKHQQG